MLPKNSRPYDPFVKSPWWREDHYCNYHRNKCYNTDNFLKLKNVIQDLIDEEKVSVDELAKKYDHMDFKKPLPKYEK